MFHQNVFDSNNIPTAILQHHPHIDHQTMYGYMLDRERLKSMFSESKASSVWNYEMSKSSAQARKKIIHLQHSVKLVQLQNGNR